MIIGLLGPAGAGKTTIANYLESRYGAKRYTFAHPLKKLVRATFNVPKEALYGTQAEKEMPREEANMYSGRQLMQRVGQAVRQTFGVDFWANRVVEQIIAEKPNLAVVEDVRHVNEAEIICGYGARIWRIVNPNRDTTADATHPSESEWMRARFDDTIGNDGKSLTRLHVFVDELCWKYTIFPKRPELPL